MKTKLCGALKLLISVPLEPGTTRSGPSRRPKGRNIVVKCCSRRSLGNCKLLPAVLAFLGGLNNLCGQGSPTAKPEIAVQTGSVLPNSRIILSPDGRLLASAAFGEYAIHLWDVDSQRQLRLFEATRTNQVFGMLGISKIEFSETATKIVISTTWGAMDSADGLHEVRLRGVDGNSGSAVVPPPQLIPKYREDPPPPPAPSPTAAAWHS